MFALRKGSRNIALGRRAGYNLLEGRSNIFIGSLGAPYDGATESNQVVRIGSVQDRAFIAGIRDVPLTTDLQEICVDADDQLGSCSVSSARFKHEIRAMAGVSSGLLELRPVRFLYREGAEEAAATEQFGLIAEEVAEIYPALVSSDKNGRPFSVRYSALTPLLLNELQKQHREVMLHRWALGAMLLLGVVLTVGRYRST